MRRAAEGIDASNQVHARRRSFLHGQLDTHGRRSFQYAIDQSFACAVWTLEVPPAREDHHTNGGTEKAFKLSADIGDINH